MKKLLWIIVLGLLFSGNAYADDSYEAAFNVALKNHQYYFKHKGKTYTTNTKEKPFDFFDHGYNYHEASIYMKNNYTDPSDGNYGCMLYNGHLYQFQNSDQKKHNYLDYDKNGWKKTTFEKSKDGLVTAVLTESPTCLGASNYFQVYFDNKEIFDSRPDFKKWTSKDWLIGLNINSYIGKDYNQNGVKELFIDAGYRLGNTWTEKYYFFEYDLSTITLKKSLLADDQKKRLNISEHFQNKFSVSEEELIKVITKNFSGDTPNKKKKIKKVEIVQGHKGVLEKRVAMKTEALTKSRSNKKLFKLIDIRDTARNILSQDGFEYALSEEINDKFIDFEFEGKDRYSFLNEKFYHLLSHSSKKAYEVDINNDDFFIVTGCSDLSCDEAALLYIDKKNKIVIGSTNSKYFSDITNTDVSVMFVFSKKISQLKELPNDFLVKFTNLTAKISDLNKRKGSMYFMGPNNKIRNITQLEILGLDIKK